MNYAYARVSGKDQKLERQLATFENCGISFYRYIKAYKNCQAKRNA